MTTFYLFGREVYLEFACRVVDVKNWQLGWEHHQDAFETRLFWIGPVHGAICKFDRQCLWQ